MMNAGTASMSKDSTISGSVSASTCFQNEKKSCFFTLLHWCILYTNLQKQYTRVLLRQLFCNLIHLFTWLGPRRPEVGDWNPVKVSWKQCLEMFHWDYLDEVRFGHSGWRKEIIIGNRNEPMMALFGSGRVRADFIICAQNNKQSNWIERNTK